MKTPAVLKTSNGSLASERPCETCGETFLAPVARVESGQARFCSRPCSAQSRLRRVACTCLTCGTRFDMKQSAVAKGEGLYCSPSCYRESQRGERVPVTDRLWAKVDKDGPAPPHRPELGQCWVWTGSRQKRSGYGTIVANGRIELTHRVAYGLEHGGIPVGKHVLHACDNPPCVRPSHLFSGTHTENVRDSWQKGRAKAPPQPRADQRARGERNGTVLHPERLARGERNGMSKLTIEQAVEIRARYLQGGIRQAQLAAEYGISQPMASMVCRGVTWHFDHLKNRS